MSGIEFGAENPREHPAIDGLNPHTVVRDFRKVADPGTAACPGRLVTLRDRLTGRRNGRWVRPGGNAPDTFVEGEGSEG